MTVQINIDPRRWVKGESNWDRLGPFYEGDPDTERGAPTHTHVWAANFGAFVYDFWLPKDEWSEATVSARLSSEHPWYSSPSNHFSDATVIMNGRDYPSKRVIPDNGSGRLYTWHVDGDDLHEGRNQLQLAVKRNATYRNGLCIYHRAILPGRENCSILIKANSI